MIRNIFFEMKSSKMKETEQNEGKRMQKNEEAYNE